MMTVAFGLLAVSSYVLWRRKAGWGWGLVMAALVLGLIVFARDVDFSANLGLQL